MDKIVMDTREFTSSQEVWNCKACIFADQKILGTQKSWCTFPGRSNFSDDGMICNNWNDD